MDVWQKVAFLQPSSHLVATLSGGLAGHVKTSAETIQRDPVPHVPHESSHSCLEMIWPHSTALASAVSCGYVVRRMCEEPGLQRPSFHSFQGLTWLSSVLLGTWVDDTNLLPPFVVLTTRVNFFCVEGVESLPLQVFFWESGLCYPSWPGVELTYFC